MDETVVLYSTKHGVCEHAARQLAQNLGCGYQDVCNIRSIEPYKTIILGTSIYVGKPTKSMQVFISTHLDELLKKSIGLFIVCSYTEPNLIANQLTTSYPKDLLDVAFYKGCLANGVNMDKLNFVEKKIFTKVSGIDTTYFNFNCDEMKMLKSAYTSHNRR